MMARRFVRRLACVLVAMLAAGCDASITGDDPSTGLVVTVSKGPTQPVAREGENNSAPVEDAAVRVTLVGSGGRIESRTDAEGVVRFALRPGRYGVEVRECPGALALPAPDEAEVRSGELTPISLVCDTGIR